MGGSNNYLRLMYIIAKEPVGEAFYNMPTDLQQCLSVELKKIPHVELDP